MIKISPNLVNFLVLTSGIKIKLLLFFMKVTGNIAFRVPTVLEKSLNSGFSLKNP